MNKIEKVLALAAVLMFLGVLLLVRELNIVSNDSQASGPRRGSIFHSREDRDIPRDNTNAQTYVPLPTTPGFPGYPNPQTQFPVTPTTPPSGGSGTVVTPSKPKTVPSYNGGGGYFGASWLCQYFGVGCDYSLPLPSKYN